ncbi:MAG: CoA-binding protein [Planctomycetota bacterium]|jgi:acyl-CoA synthetase (NDP forming)
MRSNLNQVFKPRSIAVIGASTRKGSIGWYMVHNIVSSDFNGKLFPVNIKAETIHSIKCYGRVIDIPDPVDLAVICVPKEQALDVADECGRKGVRALVVITAGFKETRGEGVEREAQLLEIVRKYDMIMVGPNCMGVINTDPEVRLNATFAPELPIEGCIGFMSQSGALGVAILNLSRQLGLGLSTFISLGNKADIAANEVIEYLEQDPSTRIIALYLESVGDPRKFKELARRVTRTKPIVLVKAGRTEAGARAASCPHALSPPPGPQCRHSHQRRRTGHHGHRRHQQHGSGNGGTVRGHLRVPRHLSPAGGQPAESRGHDR